MDIEKLTKSQIVLLTLFVSFVTSIATGIVTVTLMDQAPPGITHTISKVVQTTVEKVIEPGEEKEIKTVVVGYEDDLANAAATQAKSLVRIYGMSADSQATSTPPSRGEFIGLGFVATQEGDIIADAGKILSGTTYMAVLSNGTELPIVESKQDEVRGIALLIPKEPLEDITVTPAVLSNASATKLGQSIFALGGQENTRLITSTVSGFIRDEGENIVGLQTGLTVLGAESGAPAFTIEGKTVGMVLVRESGTSILARETIREIFQTTATSTSATSTSESSLSVN